MKMFIDADGKYSFSYKRTPAVISAYGEEFVLPVRNAEFLEKLAEADKKVSSAQNIHERALALREAVSVFIGKENTDKIFPDADTADLDEMQAFILSLAGTVKQKSIELIREKYKCEDLF